MSVEEKVSVVEEVGMVSNEATTVEDDAGKSEVSEVSAERTEGENEDAGSAKVKNSALNLSGVLSESIGSGGGEGKTLSEEEYAKHVVRDESGVAIYVDPNTKMKYRWDEGVNEWVPASSEASPPSNQENPYETEHYRWCTEKQEWVLKEEKFENEFYIWSSERSEWIPKERQPPPGAEGKSYVDKDGVRYAWNVDKNAWFPEIDENFMAHYQMNYGFVDNTSDDTKADSTKIEPSSSTTVHPTPSPADDLAEMPDKKTESGRKRKAPQEPPKWFDLPPELNTKVYVSNLPEDITEEEFVSVMSKCGMIMRDIQTQKLKVKLYMEPDGQLKGDGLCDYIKKQINYQLMFI
ncbi:HIV Tat-specific factor 1 [Sergentomyia squamirostris]